LWEKVLVGARHRDLKLASMGLIEFEISHKMCQSSSMVESSGVKYYGKQWFVLLKDNLWLASLEHHQVMSLHGSCWSLIKPVPCPYLALAGV